tara:strand:+ start:394 stop:534 length:141 start_codon:yes stop_codon:yes gene_type:complete
LIATAVEAELAGYLSQFADLRTQTGHVAVVGMGIIWLDHSKPALAL